MEQAVSKVIEALKPLADKIGQGAEFLYRVYYRQTIVEGILQIVFPVVVLLILGIVLKKFIPYAIKKRTIWLKTRETYDDDFWFISIVISVCAYVLLTVASVFFIVNGSLKLANPHYYTIQRIVNSVQSKEVK